MHTETRRSLVGYKKPKAGEFLMQPGWTMPTKPCVKGHTTPRNRFGQCVQCTRIYRATRGHYSALEATKRWYQNNKEKLSAIRRNYNAANPERTLVTAARHNAKENRVPFLLEVSDIKIPEVCPVLGIPLVRTGGKRTSNSPSLDRIIPELGYVKGNVIVISWRANRIKSDASIDELCKVAKFYSPYGTMP